MRIGIFGGTFDPVHLGHLIVAEQCREQAQLDQVWFVPAARPPSKLVQPVTPFARRVEMLQLALAGHPAFRIEELEKDRPGPSFTADTLHELAQRYSPVDWFFLLGSDSLRDLPNWRKPEQIVRLATLLVVVRPYAGGNESNDTLVRQVTARLGESARIQLVDAPRIELASSDLRQRAAAGRSLRYLVPRAVECYIQEKGLYRLEH